MAFVLSEQFVKDAIMNQAENEQCCDLHPGLSCDMKALQQMIASTKSMSGVYFVVHMVPLLIKYKKVLKNPSKQIKKALFGFAKSMLFVGITLFMLRRAMCFWWKFRKFQNISASFSGILCAFPLLLESPGRQVEMTLYVFNKGSQMLYLILRRRYPWLKIKSGENWLASISMAFLSYYYLNQRDLFKALYQKPLDMILMDV